MGYMTGNILKTKLKDEPKTQLHFLTTSNFVEIETLLNKNTDEKSLVIWDVDATLIIPKDPNFSKQNCSYSIHWPIIEEIGSKIYDKPPEELRDQLSNDSIYEAFTDLEFKLLDENIPNCIKLLQQRNIPSIALTLLKTSTLYATNLTIWRYKNLLSFDINFNKLHEFQDNKFFNIDPQLNCNNNFAEFYKGIMLTNHLPKGPCLEALLKEEKYKPKNIVFIDDEIDNLYSVEQTCSKLGIIYHGIHYTAYKNCSSKWDEAKAKKFWTNFLNSKAFN